MDSFNERLRALRKGLGLNQDEFAAIGGVMRKAQMNYERGERAPDSEYLQALSDYGVDVLFLFTGIRAPQTAAALSDAEAALVASYRKASDQGKSFIQQAAGMALPAPKTKKERPQGVVKQVASGPGSSIQVGGSIQGSKVFNGDTNGDSAAAGRKRATRASGAGR